MWRKSFVLVLMVVIIALTSSLPAFFRGTEGIAVSTGEQQATAQEGYAGVLIGLPTGELNEIRIELETPDGFQPLHFSVIRTTEPRVTITVPRLISCAGYSVFHIRPDTGERRLIGTFSQTISELELSVPIGRNTILVTDTTEELPLASASMLNYLDRDVLPLSRRGMELIEDIATSLIYVSNTIILDFVEGASKSAIADFLRRHRLEPIGVMIEYPVASTAAAEVRDEQRSDLPQGIQVVAQVPPYIKDPLALERELNGTEVFPPPDMPVDPPLRVAVVDLVVGAHQFIEVASERLPDRLRQGAAALPNRLGNVDDQYNPVTGGFDDDNDGGITMDFDELNLSWWHFFLDTYAAHRVIDKIAVDRVTEQPAIAIIDTGVGNADNSFSDLPLARRYNLTDINGASVQTGSSLAQIADTGPHGTVTTVLAAGEGHMILGVGKDLKVRHLRIYGLSEIALAGVLPSLRELSTALKEAAGDSAVVVINLSWGPTQAGVDQNGNGLIDTADERKAANDHLRRAQVIMSTGIGAIKRVNTDGDLGNDKIVTISAGNQRFDTKWQFAHQSLFDVPIRGMRVQSAGGSLAPNALFMAISGTDLENLETVTGRESFWVVKNPHGKVLAGSCDGDRISVSAPGGLSLRIPEATKTTQLISESFATVDPPKTTLTAVLTLAAAGAGASIQVANAAGFPDQGVLLIDNEEIAYFSRNAATNTFRNIIRGIRKTTVVRHANGAEVKAVVITRDFNPRRPVTWTSSPIGAGGGISIPVQATADFFPSGFLLLQHRSYTVGPGGTTSAEVGTPEIVQYTGLNIGGGANFQVLAAGRGLHGTKAATYPGEDTNGNLTLDPGEDVDGNGSLDITVVFALIPAFPADGGDLPVASTAGFPVGGGKLSTSGGDHLTYTGVAARPNRFTGIGRGVGSVGDTRKADLVVAGERISQEGSITATSPATGGNLHVVSTAGFRSLGTVYVGREAISYTATAANSFNNITRGAENTAASSHRPGLRVIGPAARMTLSTSLGGTSWAAPIVAGLAGEIVFLDRNSNSVGDRLQTSPRSFSLFQVVQLIEATADDLGTSGAAVFVNDEPGNGPDDRFGWGRVNAWKATLSAVNGGLAQCPCRAGEDDNNRDDVFKSLALVDESDTEWYGFRILTSVKGATVWIDARQLQDTGATLPDPNGAAGAPTNLITAYKGVRSDHVSGVVPVGNNGGEYIITFSIKRSDLFDKGNPRTLSLRKPGQTATDDPFFNLKLDLPKMRGGEVPGVVFDDFVFEITGPDFGDALPCLYPVRLEQTGAHHLNTHLEWFGRPGKPHTASVSPEFSATDEVDPDGNPNITADPHVIYGPLALGQDRSCPFMPDRDSYDDGVVFNLSTYTPGQQSGKAEFIVCVANPSSGRYSDDRDQSLFVNGWIDWNRNGRWEEANGEHVVDGVQINPTSWTVLSGSKVHRKNIALSGNSCTFEVKFEVPILVGSGVLWARFRLDYGENVGRNDPRPLFRSDPSLRDPSLLQTASQIAGRGLGFTQGAARFGEVEDYCIYIDTIPPITSVQSSPATNELGWHNRNVKLILEAKEEIHGLGISTIYYRLNAGAIKKIEREGTNRLQLSENGRVATCKLALKEEGIHKLEFWAADIAGNESDHVTSTIRIDKTSPTIKGSISPPCNNNGWNNASVKVVLEASDKELGSGIVAIYYRLNAGDIKKVEREGTNRLQLSEDGRVATCKLALKEEGIHKLEFWAADIAGNESDHVTSTIRIDKISPTIKGSISPECNNNGWNNASVKVTLEASDKELGSGIVAIYYRLNAGNIKKIEREGTNRLQLSEDGRVATCKLALKEEGIHKLESWAEDLAGNKSALNTLTVKIDKTVPMIEANCSPGPNENGWNNTDVIVSFHCSDSLSGIASYTSEQRLSREGRGQSVTGEAVDKAGNQATTTVRNINIDKTAPSVSVSLSNSSIPQGAPIRLTVTASDALSGIGSVTASDSNLGSISLSRSGDRWEGTIRPSSRGRVTVTARDKASNARSDSASYSVEERQPPRADFTCSPTQGEPPLTVSCTDHSSGNITSWHWDFGDGGTSTDRNPSHTYRSFGRYRVTLTVRGPGGSDTKEFCCIEVLRPGEVSITLIWWSFADLDLHVIDPYGCEIYHGNMTGCPSGGQLYVDANKTCSENVTATPVESIDWRIGEAPEGEYRVYVDYYQRCEGASLTESFLVRISVDGEEREYTGTVDCCRQRVLVKTFRR